MSTKRLFAVDLGASGGKCFVGTFADDGAFSMSEVHRFVHEGISFHLPDANGDTTERTFWDDTFIYQNIIMGLQACRRDVSDTLDAIGIDTWGSDGQFLNKDGESLGKMYCYRDHRLDNMVDVIKSRMDPTRIYEITGIHFQPFNISNQLHWFVKNRTDLMGDEVSFLPVPSLFSFYLCGEKKVDSSWASVTQVMDAKTKQWSDEILEKLEVPASIMPEIVQPGTVIGKLLAPIAEAVGMNRPKVIAVASHDTAAAFAAAPVSDPDEALIISSGTWSLVGKLIPEPNTSSAAMAANISNEGGVGNIRFLKNCMGTWLAQELRRAWGVADGREISWKELNELTTAAPAFTSFVDPDDPSFYNPADMGTAIADFCSKTGQTVLQEKGALLRMVYESLALKYRLVNEQISDVSGTTTKVVNIVGGGTKNPLLNQFTANALGIPVVAGPEEATAVGNLMVQAMGMGIISSMQDAMPLIKKAFPITEYLPTDVREWQAAYDRFKLIVTTA